MTADDRARGRTLACAAMALFLAGCGAELDMAKAYDAKVAPTKIEYRGVKEETRQYGDYGTIHAAILVPPPAPLGKH